jgi:nucleotide-binding universal stress UspA family protein
MNRIVVGVDGSAGSAAALQWAIAIGGPTGAAIDIVISCEVMAPYMAPHPSMAEAEAAAQQQAEGVLAEMLAAHPSDQITGRVLSGAAVGALIEASAGADLLVLGVHGSDGVMAGIGSTAARCAVRNTVPTVVVPVGGPAAIDGPVVAGVDGSAGGACALGTALELAAAGQDVIALTVSTVPVLPGPAAAGLDPDLFEEDARRSLDDTLATLSTDQRSRVTPRLRTGATRSVLRAEAEHAAMIVIGTRGHSTLLHRLLGSAVTYLLHHHPTPVVVVPVEPGD